MSIFLILHAPQRPKEKSLLSCLFGVWCVDMFFKNGSVSPALVAALVAKRHTFKSQRTRSVSGYDWWLSGICSSRIFNSLVFMTYSAAGSIASAYHIGYATSLVIFSPLADRIGLKSLYLCSMSAGALFSLGFALLARGYLSALILYTLVAISLGLDRGP